MAQIKVASVIPVGATGIAVYPRSAWGARLDGAPSGSATVSGLTVASDGTITASLTAGVDYVAYRASPQTFVAHSEPPLSMSSSGTHATRPTAPAKGFIYYETDTGLAFSYDGSAWQTIKPGQELGYAEVTSNFATTTTGSAVDVTGLSATVTVGVRPVLVEFYCTQVFHSVAGATPSLRIYEDGVLVQTAGMVLPTANAGMPIGMRVRRAPAAGAHTYKISLFHNTAGTFTMVGTASTPASISVVER